MVSLVNSTKYLKNLYQCFLNSSKKLRRGDPPKIVLQGHHYPGIKGRQGHCKKIKWQANIPHKHRYKNPQHNTSKVNSKAH